MCTDVMIYPEGNFGGNQLLDGSISLSPLYQSSTIDLHVRIIKTPLTYNRYNGDVVIKVLNMSGQGPIFLTRINFIPNMDT